MTKERLTPSAVRSDLKSVLDEKKHNAFLHRFAFITPLVVASAVLSLLPAPFNYLLVLCAIPIIYNIVMLITTLVSFDKLYKKLDALTLDDITVTEERFSHYATETIYEPSISYFRHFWWHKTIELMYFSSGKDWRLPIKRPYYAWSSIYPTENIKNSTLDGDTFFLIVLNDDRTLKYAYNQSRFDF